MKSKVLQIFLIHGFKRSLECSVSVHSGTWSDLTMPRDDVHLHLNGLAPVELTMEPGLFIGTN